MPLKIIRVKDLKLGRTCGQDAGEVAFGGAMFLRHLCLRKRLTCLVLALESWGVFQRICNTVGRSVPLDSTVHVFCFEGIQREMGAGEPGNKVKAALPGGGGGGGEGDSWI